MTETHFYEPAKGRTLVRAQWRGARQVILAELARPAGGEFLRATRKGWWAGYYFCEPAADAGSVNVTMHRFHMGDRGWMLRGDSVTRVVRMERVAAEIDSNPDFRLPE